MIIIMEKVWPFAHRQLILYKTQVPSIITVFRVRWHQGCWPVPFQFIIDLQDTSAKHHNYAEVLWHRSCQFCLHCRFTGATDLTTGLIVRSQATDPLQDTSVKHYSIMGSLTSDLCRKNRTQSNSDGNICNHFNVFFFFHIWVKTL